MTVNIFQDFLFTALTSKSHVLEILQLCFLPTNAETFWTWNAVITYFNLIYAQKMFYSILIKNKKEEKGGKKQLKYDTIFWVN